MTVLVESGFNSVFVSCVVCFDSVSFLSGSETFSESFCLAVRLSEKMSSDSNVLDFKLSSASSTFVIESTLSLLTRSILGISSVNIFSYDSICDLGGIS